MPVNDGEIVKVVVTIDAPDLVTMNNIYYWRLDDPAPDNPSNAQIIAALDTRLDDMYGKIDDGMSDAYLVDEFSAERIEWVTDIWEVVENLGTQALAVAGLLVTDAAPHGVAGVVTAQTSRPQTRARKFLPGFGDQEMADSTLSGALLGYVAQYIVSWLTTTAVTGSAELVPVVVGQSGPSAGLIYALVSAAASGIAGYQRRRKPGVGI